MNKRKHAFCALALVLALGVAGCQSAPDNKPQQPTALETMQSINSHNILESDNDGRVWYTLNPTLFSDVNTGSQGNLRTLLQDLGYLSDGDPNKGDDLNMQGILLTDVLALDESDQPVDLVSLNPTLGTEEDLSALCQNAKGLNMPVMITLPLGAVSKNNAYFKQMVDLVNNAPADTNPIEQDPTLFNMFYIEPDHENEPGWTRIGQSNFYYGSLINTDIPRIDLNSDEARNQIIASVQKYLDLGVQGFYVPDYNEMVHNDAQSNADFANWFNQVVKDRNDQAITVFSFRGWNDQLGSVAGYVADQDGVGAEGMLAKAATGAITARDLGAWLADQANRTQNVSATFLNNVDGSMDLLKSGSRINQYKMALALLLMSSGQVFVEAGDELGIPASQSALITSAIEQGAPGEEGVPEESAQMDFEFGSLSTQQKDGNSILNFVKQAVLLRDSYRAVSSGVLTFDADRSTDQLLVLDKRKDSSETILVFNLSDAEQTLDVSGISLNGLPAELGGCLLTSSAPVTMENTTLKLPPYSMALLK